LGYRGSRIGGVWNISNNLGGWAQTGFDKIARSYTVPDGGFTASLLGVAMIGLGLIRRALA